jgi:ParB family chromosome partitioning protein
MTYTTAYTKPIQSQGRAHIPPQGSIVSISTADIYSNKPKAPQKSGKTIRLMQNIKKYGLHTPIVVTPTEPFPGILRYLVVEGEELWHAACLAELKQLPCLITQNAPREAEIVAVFAQIAAKEADMFEQAVAFRHLTDTYGLTQEEISRRAGLSQSAVANKLRLLHLTATEQKKILLNGLSERHARALLRLKSPEMRLSVLDTVCRKNLSVAATEMLIESYISPHAPPNCPIPPQIPSPTRIDSTNAKGEMRKTPKLILHSLQPLYNSLERTLDIFRKTGRNAVLASRRTEDRLVITIEIPDP